MHSGFTSFKAFLVMGHNGAFVWTAYGIVFFVLMIQWWIMHRE